MQDAIAMRASGANVAVAGPASTIPDAGTADYYPEKCSLELM
jgi:hypothetical protein